MRLGKPESRRSGNRGLRCGESGRELLITKNSYSLKVSQKHGYIFLLLALFFFLLFFSVYRTPLGTTEHSVHNEKNTDQVYIDRERFSEPISHTQDSSGDVSRPGSLAGFKFLDLSENNNLTEPSSRVSTERDENRVPERAVTFHLSTYEAPEATSSMRDIPQSPQPDQVNSDSKAPKIRQPEPATSHPGRSFRRPSDKGETTRQRRIMNSISELLRQRLDPYPLLEEFQRSGVLTDVDVQTYVSHHDRKSVCERIVNLVGDANPDMLSMFCDMLSFIGSCPEILEV